MAALDAHHPHGGDALTAVCQPATSPTTITASRGEGYPAPPPRPSVRAMRSGGRSGRAPGRCVRATVFSPGGWAYGRL
jgi:hypothetical protein